MRMEELSDSRYIKNTDQVERYLLNLVEQYYKNSNVSSPASREYIIKRAVQRMKEEISFDNMGVLSITIPDGEVKTGAVSLTLEDLNGEPLISHKLSAFNVPFGNYKNPRIIDENNLLNCSELLKKTEIKCADFSEILNKVRKGDFVYFDPPYVPLNETSSFTSYTKDGFDIDMQFKLRDVCDELDSMGVKFMLSNSDTKLVNELYENYNIKKVFASRQINANADGRGKITEVLVRNY